MRLDGPSALFISEGNLLVTLPLRHQLQDFNLAPAQSFAANLTSRIRDAVRFFYGVSR
jgi:hypothetical protein